MSMDRIKYEKKLHDLEFRDRRVLKTHLSPTPHLHRELELVCYYGDEPVVAVADSTRCTLQKGDIFLTFPNQIHYYINKEPQSLALAIINPDLMPELIEVFQTGTPTSPVVKNADADPKIHTLVELLCNVCATNAEEGTFTASQRRGYLLALFSELLSRMTIQKLSIGDSDALRSIVAFCAQNYAENLSLSVLEDNLHLNKYYISHLFSGKLKLRFNDYINSLRVSEACRHLLNSDASITEICEQVGFNTLRTFNRAFIKQMGVSPSEYRKGERGSEGKTKQQSLSTKEN